ncbi:hypothetical protein J4573_03455 [Actinomadura barringtoniae]|uniref:Peptidase C39-like domain-containing protein n=1 Tax=Actinomadura barringtoniae TaxID=1427535 RepID=A0A939P6Y0_9ACTN|nr:papain-like cysteine protease family protein [Actinomadura barringtoniae]MBO2446132.1 hypothetical protein [Actinomadura barringtoniae]
MNRQFRKLGVAAVIAATAFSFQAAGARARALSAPSPPPATVDSAEPYGSNTWVDAPKEDAAQSKLLRIDLQNQRHVAGSWAATGATIATFDGRKVDPNVFCAKAFSEAKCDVPKSQAAKLDRMQAGFRQLGIAPGRLVDGPISFDEIKAEIDVGRPVAVRVNWTVGGGHMLPVYGYDAKKKWVYWGDPWPTADNYQWASFDYLVANDLWVMTGAITHIGERAAT